MRIIFGLTLVFALFFSFSFNIYAIEHGTNNKFGIHLAQPYPDDIKKAAELVNSNGGDWGYVTLVIQENDRDKNKWQGVFDQLRDLKLIPIVRIATKADGSYWKRPQKEEADGWASFLESLNWVVKDRYVILFNEPNHSAEWGGSIDAKQFAQVSESFAEALKSKNKDYVVMLAGMDASAPQSPPFYADESDFLRQVINEITPDKFNELFGALSSHSYPNPGFTGSPNGYGRGSVRTYEWELELLKSYGVKDLPVFITETGWDGTALSRNTVADYFNYAYQNIWLPDDRVIAVTPFVLNYQGDPFLNFSWAKIGNNEFYPQYYQIQNMGKISGDPAILEKGEITHNLPNDLVMNSSYHFKITLKNRGQAIWDKSRGYRLKLDGISPDTYLINDIYSLKPNDEQDVDLYIKTDGQTGPFKTQISLYRDEEKVLASKDWDFTIVPLPSLKFKTDLYPKLHTQGNDFELQIFDEKEQLVYKKHNVEVKKSSGFLNAINNIALGRKYRVVILKPYYLPRQTHLIFKKGENSITFERMLPLDFNLDGALTWVDIFTFVQHPDLIKLFLP